jgi:hypothetical protein
VIKDKNGVTYLWVRLDPPVQSDQRTEITAVVVGPHFEGSSVWPDPTLPVPVYVYVPHPDVLLKREFDAVDFDLQAWAELYGTEAEADAVSREPR